ELLEKMQDKGIKMSKASYYRRIKDFDKFDRAEILAIAEILELNKEQILDIFFDAKVS
ncbi:TPA: BetR domain protein, partial [Staphylococcus pseudintermedius]|nr:BetR domain protein [Staphylococcus pseudintermedius]